jgi:hypothetical protein
MGTVLKDIVEQTEHPLRFRLQVIPCSASLPPEAGPPSQDKVDLDFLEGEV